MPGVVFKGVSSKNRDDGTVESFVIDGQQFVRNVPAEASDDLARELTEGSERTKGFKFDSVSAKALKESQEARGVSPRKAAKTAGDTGGSGGTASVGTQGGTTSGSSR